MDSRSFFTPSNRRSIFSSSAASLLTNTLLELVEPCFFVLDQSTAVVAFDVLARARTKLWWASVARSNPSVRAIAEKEIPGFPELQGLCVRVLLGVRRRELRPGSGAARRCLTACRGCA